MTPGIETSLILYAPLAASAVLLGFLRIYSRLKTTLILCCLWHIAALPWLDYLAQHFQFWHYPDTQFTIVKMPVTLYCGWIILWGILAPIIMGKLPVRNAFLWTSLLCIILDLVCMPFFVHSIHLQPNWWLGEALMVGLGLIPGLALAHWTLSWKQACWRSFILSISFGSIILTLTPFLAGYTLDDLSKHLSSLHFLLHILFLIGFFVFTAPAVAAVIAFTKHGKGTPIPIDPPIKLVTTSVYAYCANPMQFSIIASLALWAIYLQLPLYLILIASSLIYCCGFAKWSENKDLSIRFSHQWKNYRNNVDCWKFKLRPHLSQPATLYIDFDCSLCRQIADWFSQRHPVALHVRNAADYPKCKLTAITYQHSDGSINQSVSAISSALQHIHLGWAWLAWIITYPGIHQLIQLSINLTHQQDRAQLGHKDHKQSQ